MGRAPCCDKASVKRGPWSPEEDSKLKDYIEKHGTGGNWIALPQKAGLKRCGKSCRLRWLNYLRPNIKHGEFSEEEDRIICSLYANIGSRWSIIAAQLAGRTDNDIKNYWNTKLKKKLMALLPPPPPPPPQIRKPSYHDQYHSSALSYYNSTSTPPASMSFNGPEPNISVVPSSTKTSLPPYYQNQEACLMSATPPMQYNNLQQQQYHPMVCDSTAMLAFGSDQASCSTSSDGSCSWENGIIIKQEHQQEVAFHSYNINNNLMLCEGITTNYSDGIGGNCVDNTQQYYCYRPGEKPNGCYYQTPATPLDYDMEVIKQLIGSSNSCNDGYLSVDENKREEEAMLKYNNNNY